MKLKRLIETEKAPAAIGPYSQAIEAGGMLFTSGQLPLDPVTGLMPEGIEKQTAAALDNITAILDETGLSLMSVIKTTVYIKDMGDFARMNEVYGKYFPKPYPARSCVEVARLPMDALVEIECVALSSPWIQPC